MDTRRKLNVHKMFNLRPASTGESFNPFFSTALRRIQNLVEYLRLGFHCTKNEVFH